MNLATIQDSGRVPTSVQVQLVPFRVRSGRLELLHAPTDRSTMLPTLAPPRDQEISDAAATFGQEVLDGEGHNMQLEVRGTPDGGLVAAYLHLVEPGPGGQWPGQPLSGFSWRDVRRIPLPDDDVRLIDRALRRLSRELEAGGAAFHLVGAEFTVSELRQVHEAILRVSLDPSNFRKRVCRMVKEGMLEELSRRRPTATRPARLYRMV